MGGRLSSEDRRRFEGQAAGHLPRAAGHRQDVRPLCTSPSGAGNTEATSRLSSFTRPIPTRTSSRDSVPTLTEGGQAGFTLTRGPLRRLAEKAKANPEATFVLVIDEINRGNVAKVLGELYFLLEYRNHEVALQYSGEGFSLPGNLWFIGTMNTTDRSITLVDAALRRRFYFFGFFPDGPLSGVC